MISAKYAWCCITVYAIMSIWLAGCTNNRTNASISNVSDNNNSGYSRNTFNIKNISQLGHSRAITEINGNMHNHMYISSQKNIIYNRNYKNIQKGFYSSTTYQVKHGDTLFYIAWITGNDYRDLAQRNNITEPYNLNVGQTLQVDNKNTLITSNPSSKVFTGKILQLPNNKILPADNTIVTTNIPIAIPDTEITNWCWPTNGKIIDNFSAAEGGNKGVDISGFRGQPILATASGRVVYAGNALRGYGNLIIIKHNNDYLSAYAHNDTMLVKEQQKVRIGQKIATMGSTGTNTTRLHFEIRYKGKSVNPLRYLSQR